MSEFSIHRINNQDCNGEDEFVCMAYIIKPALLLLPFFRDFRKTLSVPDSFQSRER